MLETTNSELQQNLEYLRAEALNRDLEEALQETMAKNRFIKLLTSVATAANKSKDIDEAIHIAIREICTYAEWPVGHCYIYDTRRKFLRTTQQWHMDDETLFHSFREQTESMCLSVNNNWIGRVYQTGKPVWIMDTTKDPDFLRKESAFQCGIKAAFAFPIYVEDEVYGVMEFFSQNAEEPDESLLDIMADIGTQLGHVVQRKQFENKAHLLEEVVVNANDGIMITHARDLNGPGPEITFVNKALCDVTGYAEEEILGKTPRILQGKKTDRATLDRLKEAISQGKPFKGELINYTKSGEEYWLDVSIVPIKNRAGEVTHFAAIERDVTERKRFVADIMEAKEQAESANRSKSDFLANMSHELRTPMNGILGMAGLLQDTDLTEEQQELLNTIKSSSDNLLSILNDILDLSKIEAGMVEIDEVPYDIRNALHDVTKLYSAIVIEKDLKPIQVDIDKAIPLCLAGDLTKIQQVLRNLLSNALKFTQAGGISVSASLQEDALRFAVTDTGVGIPKERQKKIFDKFTQADESTTRNFGGTGLGLAICREFVELMGGEIGVDSEVGAGSTFWFSLPYTPLPDTLEPVNQKFSQQSDALINASQCKILVVDDHPINRLFAKKLLTKLGYTDLQFAEDGTEALTIAACHDFDAILMDCQMPKLDGYDASSEIRQQEMHADLSKRTPIIAMTANAMTGDREKCLDAGMDDYISKPVKPEVLQEKLTRWIVQPSPPSNLEFFDELHHVEADVCENTPSEHAAPPIDLEHLQMFTDGDPDQERELIDLFMDQADENILMLQQSLDGSDNEAWKSAAHRLKGASANFGANRLCDIASEGEQSHNYSSDEKENILHSINLELLGIKVFLDEYQTSPERRVAST